MSHKKKENKPKSFYLSRNEKQTLQRLQQFEEEDSNIRQNEHKISVLKIIFHVITLLAIACLTVFGTVDWDVSWMSEWMNWVNLIFAELFVYLLSEVFEIQLSKRKKKRRFLINVLFSRFILILASIFVANCAVYTFDNQTWLTALLGLLLIGVYVVLYIMGFKEGKRKAQVEADIMNNDVFVLNNLTKRFSEYSKKQK